MGRSRKLPNRILGGENPTRSRKALITSVGAISLTALLFLLFLAGGPSYHGRPLRVWLERNASALSNPAERHEAETAIRLIRTNAIPTLLALLAHRNSSVEQLIKKSLTRVKIGWLINFYERKLEFYEYRRLAKCGFRALGPQAKAAVPALLMLLRDPERRFDAAVAMEFTAPLIAEQVARNWCSSPDRLLNIYGGKVLSDIYAAEHSPGEGAPGAR